MTPFVSEKIHQDDALTHCAILMSNDKSVVVDVYRDEIHDGYVIALRRREPHYNGQLFITERDYAKSAARRVKVYELVNDMEAQ